MARKGVNCRRPHPSFTRVIVGHEASSRPVDRAGKFTAAVDARAVRCRVRDWRPRPRAGRSGRRLARWGRGDLCAGAAAVFVIEGATQSGQVRCQGRDDRADRGSKAKPSRRPTTTAISHSPRGQLEAVGGAGAHPDELPRRVMTTHPEAVHAGPMMASGGSVEAKKYLAFGHGGARRGSTLTRASDGQPHRVPILFNFSRLQEHRVGRVRRNVQRCQTAR
jgi:hypothetical protein